MNAHKKDFLIEGQRIYLRTVIISDVTKEYIHWLNDPEVNKYLESRFMLHTRKNVKEYVKKKSQDPDVFLLAIIEKHSHRHIGNIKLGPIERNHWRGDIGIMIGDKNFWGKGYATQAIALLVDWAFHTLKLHKVTAGACETNVGSIKAFLKTNFFEEGRRKKHFLVEGKFIDEVLLAKINTSSSFSSQIKKL